MLLYEAPGLRSQLLPEMSRIVREYHRLGGRSVVMLSPAESRAQPTLVDAAESLAVQRTGAPALAQQVGEVIDFTIPLPAGQTAARRYVPSGVGEGVRTPVIVYWHSGGFVRGDLDTGDAACRALCEASGAIVVSCEYRKAPEHPFPAAIDDAFNAYLWITRRAGDFGGDRLNIAVAGEDAGGTLATVVARRTVEQGLSAPVHQLLIYPILVHTSDTLSAKQHSSAEPLSTTMMQWFWGRYLASPGDGTNADASPLLASSLTGMPPTTIINADIDPLRSEGEVYAARLQNAGVPVFERTFPGVTHEFFGLGVLLPEAREAVEYSAAALRTSFTSSRQTAQERAE